MLVQMIVYYYNHPKVGSVLTLCKGPDCATNNKINTSSASRKSHLESA